MEQKFYKTDSKAVVALLSGEAEGLNELLAGTTDAAVEKHVPVYEVTDEEVCIKVGEVDHPMIDAHYIEWVAVKTDKGFYVKYLKPHDTPEACIKIDEDETIETVYAYCNLHGLWKA